MFRTHVIEKI